MKLDISDPLYQQKLTLLNVLKQVIDPELDINIIDLGLIYEIDIDEKLKIIKIIMTLSTPSCPVGGIMKSNIEQMLTGHAPDYVIIVNLVFEPRWSLDMVNEAGKSALGW